MTIMPRLCDRFIIFDEFDFKTIELAKEAAKCQ